MKPWFEISAKSERTNYSHRLGHTAKPIGWQGWFVTSVYYADLAGIGAYHLPAIRTAALAFCTLLLAFAIWHTGVLWLASRHFVKTEDA